MFRTFTPFLLLLAAVVQIAAQNYIEVGPVENPFSISPPYVNVDTESSNGVALTFHSTSASIQQSTFENPCALGGKDYFMFNFTAEKSQAAVTIKFADLPGDPPYWFFDGFNDHCQKGMVFAINPESEDQYNDFKSRAISGAAPLSATTSSGKASSTGTTPSSTSSSASATSTEASDEKGPNDGAMSLSAGSVVLISTTVAVMAGWTLF
ncbi:hypothetical protein QCA50_001093 [Cerrena zonata]|uniref:Uncharacterized protein n=1 Tax=Cerrena zonata TaxID=2478898 RepID=A0AAW0H0R7_9APHY